MSSNFNLLIPRFSDEVWDSLIPANSYFSDDLFTFEFTYASTRASISNILISVQLYCCSLPSDITCYEDIQVPGTFFMFYQVARSHKGIYRPAAQSATIFNPTPKTFSCLNQLQPSQCPGSPPYDTSIYDVDLYGVFLNWEDTSLSNEGDLASTRFHDLVINDTQICTRTKNAVPYGRTILASLTQTP